MTTAGHFINGNWISGEGSVLISTDPATGQAVWEGRAATPAEVDRAVGAARAAAGAWASSPLAERITFVEAFAEQLRTRRDQLAEAISRETGKPKWESLEEVAAMIGKAPTSMEAMKHRRSPTEDIQGAITAATRYKPHGVTAVLGPFNLPGHLPNGHIIPALLAGNTVVFKPSEMTPLVGQITMECWQAARLPAGVINMVQGARDTGAALAAHPDLDGLFFTGSFAAGQALHRLFAGQPQKILALEMGGNNPLMVWDVADPEAAAYITIQSAYITSGQRCTCARRLIVAANESADRFVDRLTAMIGKIRIGPFTENPEPFMGPVISASAADRILAAQADLKSRGGNVLIEMKRLGDCPAMLTPGLMNVTAAVNRPDVEIFGPFLQLIRVNNFEAAIDEANRTAYGLAAGLLCDDPEMYRRFYEKIRAGVVSWNRPTTGASGKLPFGGIGLSGNHWPSGYWAADYCSYPIASLEVSKVSLPAKLTPGLSP